MALNCSFTLCSEFGLTHVGGGRNLTSFVRLMYRFVLAASSLRRHRVLEWLQLALAESVICACLLGEMCVGVIGLRL